MSDLKFPAGKVVEVISHKCAVLVETVLTFSNTDQYGITTSTEETKIVPARILTRGTKGVQDYFCYEVGEKVLLTGTATKFKGINPESDPAYSESEWRIYVEDYENFCIGDFYVLGSFYDKETYDKMPAKFEEVQILKFGDGNFIEFDNETKELWIKISGDITINGKGIFLNG